MSTTSSNCMWWYRSRHTIGCLHLSCATTFSKLGGQFPGLRYYYPSPEFFQKGIPRLAQSVTPTKKLRKSGGSVQIFGVRTRNGCTHVTLIQWLKWQCVAGGGAQPLRSRRTKISIQCCSQKLHFKLTAYFSLAFKSRFMMKTAQETASRKRK